VVDPMNKRSKNDHFSFCLA